MVRVEEGREFRFCRDLYSQESTFPLVCTLFLVLFNIIKKLTSLYCLIEHCFAFAYCSFIEIACKVW